MTKNHRILIVALSVFVIVVSSIIIFKVFELSSPNEPTLDGREYDSKDSLLLKSGSSQKTVKFDELNISMYVQPGWEVKKTSYKESGSIYYIWDINDTNSKYDTSISIWSSNSVADYKPCTDDLNQIQEYT